jgi:hypothetical protein
MSTTPVLLLPFPADTDPADVPTDLQDLAERVEAVRGAPNGLAALDAAGKLPSGQRGVVPLVTALPATPADGDEVILCDNAGLPAYSWRLRWNATDGRWQFVGGTGYRNAVAASETTNTIGSYVNLATLGPRVTIPRAGDYTARFGCTVIDSAADSQINIGLGIGDWSGAPLAEARGHISAANYHLTITSEAQLNGLAAGAELRAKYQHAIAGTLTVLNRFLTVSPTRLT